MAENKAANEPIFFAHQQQQPPMSRALVSLASSLIHAGVGASLVASGERRRVNHRAQQRNFVLAFRETSSKSHRLKVFLQLWWLSAKSRDITVANFLFALALLPTNFGHVLERALMQQEVYLARRRAENRLTLPQRLWVVTPDSLKSLWALLDIALFPKRHPYISTKWTSDLRGAATATGVQAVAFQVTFALIETVLVLIYADDLGAASSKKSLLLLAKQMNVDGVSRASTADELRVLIARHLLAENK